MSEEKLIKSWVTVTYGLRGWFSVLVGLYEYPDGSKLVEPIQSGYFSYQTKKEAEKDAKDWADAEGLELE